MLIGVLKAGIPDGHAYWCKHLGSYNRRTDLYLKSIELHAINDGNISGFKKRIEFKEKKHELTECPICRAERP